jgi:hypothetical protein
LGTAAARTTIRPEHGAWEMAPEQSGLPNPGAGV